MKLYEKRPEKATQSFKKEGILKKERGYKRETGCPSELRKIPSRKTNSIMM